MKNQKSDKETESEISVVVKLSNREGIYPSPEVSEDGRPRGALRRSTRRRKKNIRETDGEWRSYSSEKPERHLHL